jgi:GNAT superfamily N-acetyltransferase
MAVTARPLEARDEPAWRQLWLQYCRFYGADISEQMTALTWARLLDGQFALQGWCAELDDKVIGFVHALEHPSTWSKAPYVYLEDLYVDEATRKTGAGSALITAVYNHADKIGSPKVYWQTGYSNANARSLYEKIGKDSGYIVYSRR